MPDTSPTDAELREQLVAYLDGELNADEEAAIENRMAGDKECRGDMQRFERVWNALDALPRATVDESFTQTTIEMVAIEAEREVVEQTQLMPARKRSRNLRWIAAGVAAAILGFLASRLLAPNPNRVIYAELPIIAEFDAYNQRLDVEFLRQLPNVLPQEFGDVLDPQIVERGERVAELSGLSYLDRAEYISGLDEETKYDFAAKAGRFEAVSQERREELQNLHTQISEADDSAVLWQSMLVYSEFTARLPAEVQADLRGMPTDERLARLRELAKREYRRRAIELSSENAQRIRDGLPGVLANEDVQRSYESLQAKLPIQMQKGLDLLASRDDRGLEKFAIMMAAARAQQHQSFEARAYMGFLSKGIIELLDEETQSRFYALPLTEQSDTLRRWVFQAKTRPSEQDIEEFFGSDKLSDDDRRRLLARPPEEMMQKLREIYAQEYLSSGNAGEYLRGFMDRDRRWQGSHPRGDRPPGGPKPRGPEAGGPPGGMKPRGPETGDSPRGPGRPGFNRPGFGGPRENGPTGPDGGPRGGRGRPQPPAGAGPNPPQNS